MNAYRLFVLLAWLPGLGAYVYPVAVMGVGCEEETFVSWVPLTYEQARPWRRRLRTPVAAERIDMWLAAGQLAEVAPPDVPVPMPEAVEGLLDHMLVEVVPALLAGER